ncbi:MAG: ribosomal RNA small subunit methyltransferase A [Bacteroidetes bacterium]|nr:ribosomal RNA small subunit methyltransferase A [Bacteroidota bacterium]MBU1113555.1 ribosomal RNA small subunit methyltransferase A [Bacteroidota bacterium]MBU1800283.1 ribosomal RNA small subunit methyltransferase A [Bacteroidota bacterium]
MKNKPLKKFGQNYLTDRNTILKIIDKFNPQKDDEIIEIGPGRGALTNELSKKCNNIKAIEIDTRVIESLSIQFPNIAFINKDFLKLDFNEIYESSKLRVIGNIPYNITSPIIFKLIENRTIFSDALMMVQYEVAKRMISKPNTKDYGILGVILNYFTTVNLEFKIPPTVFIPKPKVDSAIISLNFDKDIDDDLNDRFFINVVKAAFGNRRKTLKNSLNNSIFVSHNLNEVDFDFSRRAETLSIEEFVWLAKTLSKQNDNGRK